MTKGPYWAMIGASVGFFVGILMIMLVAADFSLSNIAKISDDPSTLPAFQVRIVILIICVIAGILIGFTSGFVISED
jgi:hypothetical protein